MGFVFDERGMGGGVSEACMLVFYFI
jgi:hypothetical protein